MLDDDVDAALARPPLGLLDEILRAVVDDVLGADPARELDLVVAAALAERLDRARHLAAVDVRQPFGRRKAAIEQQHVDVIERARLDAHDHLCGRGRRIPIVAIQDFVAAAVLLEVRRLQNGTSVRSSFTRRALWSQRGSAPGSVASTVTRMPRPTRSASLSWRQSPSHSARASAGDGSMRNTMSSSPSRRRKSNRNLSSPENGRLSNP